MGAPRLIEHCHNLLALEGDGGALRIVLVVGVGRLRRRENAGMVELEADDLRPVARQLGEQPSARGHT
ncbi:MAG: hypothetical protein ABJA34_13685, partial [Pseudonocardiales bacterium]